MLKNFLTILMCVLLCFMSIPVMSIAADDSKAQIDSLNKKYDDLEKKQKAINAEISKAKTEKEKMVAQKKQLDSQISTTKNQISVLNEKIRILEKSLEKKMQEVENKGDDIDKIFDGFKERMRSMYVAPKSNTLSLIFGSKNFTEFLTTSEYVSRTAERDKALLDDMRGELTTLQHDQIEIEASKKEIEESKAQVANKEAQLAKQVKGVEAEIQDLAQLETEYKNNKSKLDKEMQQIQGDIEKIYDSMKDTLDQNYVGGNMTWPVPSHYRVSSDFGWRFSNTDYHTGIDIAGTGTDGKGIYGKAIVSVNSGKVIFTQTSYIVGKGYGIYIMVDHGGGISTLYGHTSKLAVKVGATVKRGQTIAYVGSTGWSTGPHLHFEVRKNGKYVNPWGYIKKP